MDKNDVKGNLMKLIIILGIVIIPLLYSFFYLSAFWDPYSNLEGLPIAIVNADKGNETENLGKKLADSIIEEKAMNFQTVEFEEAFEGLEQKRFYAMIIIPEDFTEKMNSAETDNKTKAQIVYSPNQKTNYIAAQMVNTAVNKIEIKLQAEVAEKIVSQLTENLNDVPDDLEKINDAAKELQNGSSTLTNGLKTISEGMETLDTNYDKFNAGVITVSEGTQKLDTGIDSLNTGINQLHAGSKQLAESTAGLSQLTQLGEGASVLSQKGNELVAGIEKYVAGVNGATEQLGTLLASIVKYGEQNPTALEDDNFAAIYKQIVAVASSGQLEQLQTSGEAIKSGSQEYNAGITKLSTAATESNLAQLTGGINSLEQGAEKVQAGAQELKQGSATLAQGSSALSESSKQIKEGIKDLREGSISALEGSRKLLNGQTEFVNTIRDSISDVRKELTKTEGLADYTKDPVEFIEIDDHHVESYGVGLAPYFMSLSLWVGGLTIFIGIYLDSHNRFKVLGWKTTNRVVRSLVYTAIALAQAIVLATVLQLTLGFNVPNQWAYYGAVILISMTFLSIIQFLMVNFGDAGKFLVILFLVLQLSSSGGTFPMETLPDFYQNLYQYMPMSYSLDLLKEVTVGATSGIAGFDVMVLFIMFGTFLGGTIVIDILKMGRMKLHEAIENRKK